MEDNKHLTEEEIAIYADAIILGNISSLPKNIIKHVQNCDECAEKILMVTSITEDIIEDKRVPTIKKINFNAKKYILRIAASVILITGIGIIYQQIRQTKFSSSQKYSETIDSSTNKSDNSGIIKVPFIKKNISENNTKTSKQKITQKKQDTKLLAYAENKHLEKLVNRFKETSLRGGFSINAKSITVLNNKKPFILKLKNGNKELLLINFFDNKGDKLFEEKFSKKNYKTKKIKKQGLYYWKLLNEDYELLFCGKIIVK